MDKECSIVASEPRNTRKGLLNMWKQDLIDREEKRRWKEHQNLQWDNYYERHLANQTEHN